MWLFRNVLKPTQNEPFSAWLLRNESSCSDTLRTLNLLSVGFSMALGKSYARGEYWPKSCW